MRSTISPFFGKQSINSDLVSSTTVFVTHHALVCVKEILFEPLLLYFNNTGNTIIYPVHSFQQSLLSPHHLTGGEISERVRLTNLT